MSEGARWALLAYAAVGVILALIGAPEAVRYVASIAGQRISEKLSEEEKEAVGPGVVKLATTVVECVAPFAALLFLAATWPWAVGLGIRGAIAKRGRR
jgi:hypothetical protein